MIRTALVLFLMIFSTTHADEYTVMDFEEPALLDGSWFAGKPNGAVTVFVKPKTDSGTDLLKLAPGEGRNGSNALLVECPDAASGLPGFWVFKGAALNGKEGNVHDERGYLLPRGRRANRLEFWVRFEDGFQANASVNHIKTLYANMSIGTYHVDPAKIANGIQRMDESDGWHFYHQLIIDHKTARDGWIHVVVNDVPQFQRSFNSTQRPKKPTGLAGNYWELATRFYIDIAPGFTDPETPRPAKMWVDDIKLSYVPETHPVSMDINGWPDAQKVDLPTAVQTQFPVNIRNLTSSELTGRFQVRSNWGYAYKLLDENSQPIEGKPFTLAANQSRVVKLQFTPAAGIKVGTIGLHGLVFVASTESRQSLADPNVWLSNSGGGGYTGPPDATVAGVQLVTVIGPIGANLRPVTQGGKTFLTLSGTTLEDRLEAVDANGQPLTYVLTYQSPSGGTIVLQPNGEFRFTPATGFTGSFRFRYKVSDGIEDSQEVASWIITL